MRRFFLVALFAVACGPSRTTCVIPANVPPASFPRAYDGGTAGCGFTASVEACEQENDGSQKCTNYCTDAEYGLSCSGSVTADDSLHCKVEPLLTPSGVTIYCCPCSQ